MDSIELNEPDEEGKPTYRPPADIPAALAPWADQSWFVGWAAEPKNRRWTKVPKDARTGRNASVSDRRTWAPAATALDGVERHGHDGIGLVLTEEAGIIGIDLDDCINDAGLLSPLAAEIISYGETYAEVSPSGNGIQLFVLGKIDRPLKDDKAGVEVYAKDRYLTITGNHIDGTPREVREAPRTLAKLLPPTPRPNGNGKAHHPTGDDFFSNVNAAALARRDDWVPDLHPTARKQTNGAWRVTSRQLGRNIEEDLSYHADGIKDHGEECGLTPIDAVLRYGRAQDAVEAARWLCQKIGVEPAGLGWKGKQSAAAEQPDTEKDAAVDIKAWPFMQSMAAYGIVGKIAELATETARPTQLRLSQRRWPTPAPNSADLSTSASVTVFTTPATSRRLSVKAHVLAKARASSP